MNRPLTLAAVLTLLPAAACGQASDAELDAKAKAADTAIEAAADTTPETETEAETASSGTPYEAGSGTVTVPVAAPWVTVAGTDGADVALADIMGEAGAVIVFNRSAEWCPFCQKQMIGLEAAKERLDALGLNLVLLTYDSPEVLKAFAAEHDLTYTFVSDTDSETITAWGLLNTGIPEGSRYYGVPHPGFAVLSADGTIQALEVEQNYKIRPSVDDIVTAAEAAITTG